MPYRKLAVFTTATSGAQPELTSLAAIPIQGQVWRFSLRPETALLFSNRRRGFLVLRLLQEKRRPNIWFAAVMRRPIPTVNGIYDRHNRNPWLALTRRLIAR